MPSRRFMMSHLIIRVLFIHLFLIWVIEAQQIVFPGEQRGPCYPQDSCRTRGNSRDAIISMDRRSCNCDDLCSEHGDCCTDAPLYDPETAERARIMWECTDLRNYFGIFLKVACPSHWRDNQVREACESQSTESDPMSKLPVTSRTSQLTYKNMHCAVCNNDINSLIYWIPHLECGDKPLNFSFGHGGFWDRIQFNEKLNLWGFPVQNSTFISCTIDPQMPQTVVDLVRRCVPFVKECKPEWKDESVRRKCHSYTSYMFEGETAYRNRECGVCNSIENPLRCVRIVPRFKSSKFNLNIFTMLFDVNQITGDVVGAIKHCDESQIYDPFARRCRDVVCAKPEQSFRDGKCIPEFPDSTQEPLEDFNTDIVVFPIDDDIFSEEYENSSWDDVITSTFQNENNTNNNNDVMLSFGGDVIHGDNNTDDNVTNEQLDLDCEKFAYNESDFTELENRSVYLKAYNRVVAPKDYQRNGNKLYICIKTVLGEEFSNYSHKFSAYLSVVSVIGLGISILCLIIHLICFLFVPDLQNLSGKNLASLCLSLLLAYTMFIVAQFNSIPRLACTVVGVAMFFAFLSSFFWMNTMAYDVWRALRQATAELRVSSGRQWRRFLIYSTYSWLSPALIVAISVVIENIKSIPKDYQPGFGLVLCWFSHRRALLLFFVVPVVTVILINVVLFSLSAYMILATTKNAPKLNSTKSQRNFRLYLRLALLMGLTWLMGIIAALSDFEVFWYIFVCLNTLQGLFIFFAFTCTKKVMRSFYARLTGRGLIGRKFTLANSTSASRATNKSGLEPKNSHSSQTSRTSLTETYSGGSTEHTLY
uniref:G-protein coupled receptors family 2 profile 2 domain-containing protein n=1 Tax=Strigamia maritima TaxID=126957 RepID=T1IQX9_STRMM